MEYFDPLFTYLKTLDTEDPTTHSPETDESTNPEDEEPMTNAPIIVGSVVGGALAIGAIGFTVYYFCKRNASASLFSSSNLKSV